MKKIIIYGLKDPNTNQIRYIGKTQNELYKRLSGHYRDKRKNYKTHWINSLKAKNQKPIIEIIEICSLENWQERERFWISEFKKFGTQLTNWSDGGQGQQKGYKHSKDAILKIQQAAINNEKGKFKKGHQWDKKCAEGNRKKILKYSLDGKFIKEYKGVIVAAKDSNTNKNSISACLNNKLKQAGGFQWKYFTENYPKSIDIYKHKRGNFNPKYKTK